MSDRAKIQRAIRRLVKAEIAKSWIGSLQDDRERIEVIRKYTLARGNLNKLLAKALP